MYLIDVCQGPADRPLQINPLKGYLEFIYRMIQIH